MKLMKRPKRREILWLLWVFEGIIVGLGAILPGISGGALCASFGMYRPLIETLSNPVKGIKTHGLMLALFIAGVVLGFVGLADAASSLMAANILLATSVFVGFIIGTFPQLWKEAGSLGRNKSAYISLVVACVVMLMLFALAKMSFKVEIRPGAVGFLICGFMWGLSFIIPGLSSSSFLLLLGLYQPMLEGISNFTPSVIIYMGIGLVACILMLSKAVGYAYKKHSTIVSHAVIGIVAATIMVIICSIATDVVKKLWVLIFMAAGAALSYYFTRICSKLKNT